MAEAMQRERDAIRLVLTAVPDELTGSILAQLRGV